MSEPIARVRLRAGRELEVVDLSPGGALVQGVARLLPGTHVDVHVITRHGRVLVRSRIARAYVCHLQADSVTYRGALAFERLVDTAPPGYGLPGVLLDAVTTAGNAYPAADGSAEANTAATATTHAFHRDPAMALPLVGPAHTARVPSPEEP